MNEYAGEARKRGRSLLIVEGDHEKNKLFWLIFRCFPEININMDDIWIYGTNIYMLYGDIVKEYGSEWADEEEDIDLPFIISKKQHLEKVCYKEDFVNIILVFDYERHDTNFSETKILEMQGYFTDAADMGKLYINYPMIESYQHLKALPDYEYADRKVPVSLQPGRKYKALVDRETTVSQIVEFPHRIVNSQYQIKQENFKKCFENLELTKILQVQNIASQNSTTGYIWVLNTCVFFVAEYNFSLVLENT